MQTLWNNTTEFLVSRFAGVAPICDISCQWLNIGVGTFCFFLDWFIIYLSKYLVPHASAPHMRWADKDNCDTSLISIAVAMVHGWWYFLYLGMICLNNDLACLIFWISEDYCFLLQNMLPNKRKKLHMYVFNIRIYFTNFLQSALLLIDSWPLLMAAASWQSLLPFW